MFKKWVIEIVNNLFEADGSYINAKFNQQVLVINDISKYLNKRINEVQKIPFVECEICGCLLKKETAFKGKSKIVKETETFPTPIKSYTLNEVEVIKETYFCKIHKPQIKT